MKEKSFINRNEKKISIILLVSVIAVWSAVLLIEGMGQSPFIVDHDESGSPFYGVDYEPPGTSVAMDGCHVEYGSSRCIDGRLVTSFFNPGTEPLRRVSMYFSDGDDVDIYNCREPLPPGEKGTLTTIVCSQNIHMADKKLEWCCGESCNSTMMDEPSDDLSIVTL